jgi:hypothetical protein
MPQRRLLLLPQLQSLLLSMQWQRWRLTSQLLLLLLSPAMRAGAQLLVQCHAAMMQTRRVGAAAPAGAAPAAAAAAVAHSLLQQHPQSLPLHLRVAAAAEVRQQERLQMLPMLMLMLQLTQASSS